jgi:hypothetical protein
VGAASGRAPDTPPHAAPVRQRPEDPLVAAERMMADAASELTDEQSWDIYAEIDDERQRAIGSRSLIDRLVAHIGRTFEVRLSTPDRAALDVGGTLVEVGQGWIELADAGITRVVNVSAIVCVKGLTADVSQQTSTVPRRSWPSLLRQLSLRSNASPILLLGKDGLVVSVFIASVGSDHVDCRPELGTRVYGSQTLTTIPIPAIVMLTQRAMR